LAAGLLAGIAEHQHVVSPESRLLLLTGLLGGFTTFSAFGLETVFLLRRGDVLVAGANVARSVVIGLGALRLGMALGALTRGR
jgi:CrcB protein